MKQYLMLCAVVVASLLLPLFSSGQSAVDSISYTEEVDTDTSFQYLSSWDYAFMMHEETPWMLKGTLGAFGALSLGIERRLYKSLTINLNARVGSSQIGQPIGGNIAGTAELRWYYHQKKRMTSLKTARNLSGNYLALGTGFSDNPNSSTNTETYHYLRWGAQRRFLKTGFIDLGLNVGTTYNTLIFSGTPSRGILINTSLDLGLVFARDNERLAMDKLCPVLKCYDAHKLLIKTDFTNLFRFNANADGLLLITNPSISVERKLGQSPFSLSAELDLVFNYFQQPGALIGTVYQGRLLLEGRYYYNLKRRIRRGRSGNGLSANYFSLGTTPTPVASRINSELISSIVSDTENGVLRNINPEYRFATGIQRVIGNHWYYDMNVGISTTNNIRTVNGRRVESIEQSSVELDAGIKAGYRF